MAKILSFFRAVRNNWKKSVVGVAALSYGVSYSKEAYDTEQFMRECSESIVRYGDAPLPTNLKPRHVTVILNPAAKKRKAKQLFEKYSEPLLHLAGIAVTVIQTTSNSQARNIVMNLENPTDAIIVAGGDGTVSDVLTGLIRKYERNFNSVKLCPIGILPLGETSRIANSLYHKYDDLQNVREIVEATVSIINNTSKMMDVVEVETFQQDSEEPVKPIYAMGSIEWGAWRDAHAAKDKYWYWGSLKKYATYVFNGYKSKLSWNCDAVVKYTDPCGGCSNCYLSSTALNNADTANRRWWHVFIPRSKTFAPEINIDYSKIVNENCGVFRELPVSTTELHIQSPNINKSQLPAPSLKMQLAPKNVDYMSFVSEGWRQENESRSLNGETIEARCIEIIPQEVNSDHTIYIDNEDYELKAVRIKLLPKSVKIFCPEPQR